MVMDILLIMIFVISGHIVNKFLIKNMNIEVYPFPPEAKRSPVLPITTLTKGQDKEILIGREKVTISYGENGVIQLSQFGVPIEDLPTFLDKIGGIVVFPTSALELRPVEEV